MTEPVSLHDAEQTLEAAQPKRHAAYPAYRPSGIDWLGDVPEHWEVKPLKYIASIKTGFAFSSDDFVDEGVPLLRIGDIGRDGKVHMDAAKHLPINYIHRYPNFLISSGDIVMAMTGATIGKAGRYNANSVALLNQRVCSISALTKRRQDFLWFLLNAPFYMEYILLTAFGGAQPNISDKELLDCSAPVPPCDEQQAIARFLDEQTKKIDDLIEAKRDLLALLKEKRQAVISHAVTKGLNHDARLKHSGVDWLGDVPEHWDVLPVRRRTNRLQTGSTPPTQEEGYYENGSVAWYGPSSFSEAVAIGSPVKSINAQAVRDGVARLFAADSVLVVTIGATLGKIAWLPEASSTNQQITAITFDSRRVFGKFAAYQLKSVEQILRSIAPSATLPILDQQEVASIPMAFPPRDEQEAIVAHLDMEVGKLDSIIAETQRAIEQLVELRSSVISAAVTGKIDVRGGAA